MLACNLFFRVSPFLENDIVFTERVGFFQYFIDLVPSKYNPRTQYEEYKAYEETEYRWIEKNGYT